MLFLFYYRSIDDDVGIPTESELINLDVKVLTFK